jgi:adenine-specific DNA-methyltransferase
LARTRLIAAKYSYYLLADSPEGIKKESELTGKLPPEYKTESDIRKGFVYKRVPHIMLKSIANNPDIKEGMTRSQIDDAIARHADAETLYDQPYEDNKRVRVCGPFSVESLSPHRMLSTGDDNQDSTETEQEARKQQDFATMILDNLRNRSTASMISTLCRAARPAHSIAERNTAAGGKLPLNTNGGGLSYLHSSRYGMYPM